MFTDSLEYRYESDLQSALVEALDRANSPTWKCVSVLDEFNYVRGKTDVVALNMDGHVLAFEAKLSRWKIALHQAYRNTCFAHYSFVVVPKGVAKRIFDYQHYFAMHSVGLCYINSRNELECLIEATYGVPIQPRLTQKVVSLLLEETIGNGSTT